MQNKSELPHIVPNMPTERSLGGLRTDIRMWSSGDAVSSDFGTKSNSSLLLVTPILGYAAVVALELLGYRARGASTAR